MVCLLYHLHYPGAQPGDGVPDGEAGPLRHCEVNDELLGTLLALLVGLVRRYEGEVGRDVGEDGLA